MCTQVYASFYICGCELQHSFRLCHYGRSDPRCYYLHTRFFDSGYAYCPYHERWAKQAKARYPSPDSSTKSYSEMEMDMDLDDDISQDPYDGDEEWDDDDEEQVEEESEEDEEKQVSERRRRAPRFKSGMTLWPMQGQMGMAAWSPRYYEQVRWRSGLRPNKSPGQRRKRRRLDVSDEN